MRLQLILPQVNATEYGKVLVCPNEDCQSRHFVHHQEVDKPVKDTKYRVVAAHRYLCWLLNSSTQVPCAETVEIRYHAVQSTTHLESVIA